MFEMGGGAYTVEYGNSDLVVWIWYPCAGYFRADVGETKLVTKISHHEYFQFCSNAFLYMYASVRNVRNCPRSCILYIPSALIAIFRYISQVVVLVVFTHQKPSITIMGK